MSVRTVFFTLFLVSAAAFCSLVWGDEATLQRFLAEAPSGWSTVDTVYSSKAFTVKSSNSKAEVVQLGVERRASGYEDKNGEQVEGSNFWFIGNLDYRATIGTNGGEYFIGSIKVFSGEPPCTDFESNSHCRPSFCFLGSCVFDCIVGMDGFHNSPEKKAFVVTDAASATLPSGEDSVVLSLLPAALNDQGQFEVPPMPPQLVDLKVSLTLIPSRNWCIKSFEKQVNYISPKGKQVSSEGCLFEFSGENCHPSSKREYLQSTEPKIEQRVFVAYSELNPHSVSEDEFRLTAFGLPEPAVVLQQPNRMPYIIAGFVGLAAIAYFCYRKLR